MDDPSGPIEHFSWGTFVVDGKVHSKKTGRVRGAGKDIRIVNGMVTPWKEREGHTLTPEMITGIEGMGLEVLVIGIGVNSLIQVPSETRQAISRMGIVELVMEPTPNACQRYNQFFRAGRKVALLAHGTC